ncbi:MAG: hypothetical protein Dbin4_01888 [Alphaproteobacteria bacterium]|nr:hypothetical protein [Alphaproteobacteria bacterium]
MATITFDTLKFANRLKSAGVSSAHAEAEAEALAEVFDLAGRDLVTKEYFDTQLTQLEQRMTIKLGALMVGAVGVVAACW